MEMSSSPQGRTPDITITTLANLADHAQAESLGLGRPDAQNQYLEQNSHYALNAAYRAAVAARESQINSPYSPYPKAPSPEAQIAQTLLFQHVHPEMDENSTLMNLIPHSSPSEAQPARIPAKRGRKPKNASSAPNYRDGEAVSSPKHARSRGKKAATSTSPSEVGEEGAHAGGEASQVLGHQGEATSDPEEGQHLQEQDVQELQDNQDPEKMDPEDFERRRKESHKEVERRRRDNINNGILELSKIVPECEKNKGSVLHKSVEYIKYLQKTNLLTIEKWREERKDAEERIQGLTQQLQDLREENEQLRRQMMDPSLKRRREEEDEGRA